jgi:hypothetical protein
MRNPALKKINQAISIDSSKSFAFMCRGIIESDLKDESSALTDYCK